MISRVLREGGDSVYIEIGCLIKAPARSSLRITEPNKSRVTYLDSTPFSCTGFSRMFPKQNKSEFPIAKQNCKRRRARAPPAMPGQASEHAHVFPLFSPPHMLQVARRASSLLRRSPSPRISKVVLNSPCMPSHEVGFFYFPKN